MKPLLSRESSRAFDSRIIAAGVPGLLLMENAGRGAAEVMFRRFAGHLERVVVVGGVGQNGGDAWVIARRLLTSGYEPEVFLAGSRSAVQGDARVNLETLDALKCPIVELSADALAPLRSALASATSVVEGLFGTGLDRDIEGWRREVIEILNRRALPTLAIDLPSGVDANTGAVLGVAVQATLTATMAGHKRGLWQVPGREHAGEIVCVDIGVPGPVGGDVLLELSDAARWLSRRPLSAHKGTAGHVLVVAGSPGKTGAALLSGHGALRGGAGLVTLAARGSARDALEARVYELMTTPLPTGAEDALEAALDAGEGKAAAVVGPGLGLDADGKTLAVELARRMGVPTVVDADALTAVAEKGLETLRNAPEPRILTPHPGEAARLLGVSIGQVQADRYSAARRLAERSEQVVVLKGAGTVIASPDGRLAVCPLGTPALGVAGTGDVLSGALAAGVASHDDVFEAACAMVILHARAGELARQSDRGLLAREVADCIPAALEQARREHGAV